MPHEGNNLYCGETNITVFSPKVKRQQSLISVILLNRDISPNFPRKFGTLQNRGPMYFFLNLTFIILLNSAFYEPFAYNSSGSLQYTCDKVTVKFPQKCLKEIESHLVPSWKLNVENGIILYKRICHDALIVPEAIDR